MTFERKAALPRGHRLYSSTSTIAAWGSGGVRILATESYSTRGRPVTWPQVRGDWTTCQFIDPASAPHWQPPQTPEHWHAGRLCRFPESIVTGRRWSLPKHPTENVEPALQRNLVRLQEDGPSREWLAERDASGTATEYGSEGNRIERALVKEQSPLVATLRQVAELMRPAVIAANDNEPASDEGSAVNSGSGFERIHNQGSITPSVPLVLAAVSDGMRPRVIRHPNGTLTRIATRHHAVDGWHLAGWMKGRKLHGVIVSQGEIIAYGNAAGRKCKPAYTADPLGLTFDKDSEAAKHLAAQPEEDDSYIHLRGAGVYISSQRPDAPGSIAPPARTARAVANDNTLAAAIANTKTMPTVTKLPDGVARDYGRLGGIAESKGVGEGKSSAPMHEALSELERADRIASSGISAADLEVVDAVLSDASFRTIGIENGYAESSAHRMGRKVVEDVLSRLSEKIAA